MHIDGACGIAHAPAVDHRPGRRPPAAVAMPTARSGWSATARSTTTANCATSCRRWAIVFKTGSDSEVLLHGYARWGDDVVLTASTACSTSRCGTRAASRLLIGRDRLGVKPLYVLQDGTPAGLRHRGQGAAGAAGRQAPSSNRDGAARATCTWATSPAPRSHASRASASCHRRRCWRSKAARCGSGATGACRRRSTAAPAEAQWVERVRAQLEQSVRMQMVSDVPIGAFLSGGVDSSAVVGFMARHSEQPIRTYAIGFDGGAAEALYNELPYARQVAQRFGTRAPRDRGQARRRRACCRACCGTWTSRCADSAFITTYLVSEFARQDVKVILSGVGGDELFGGYRRYLGEHYAAQYSTACPAGCGEARRALARPAAGRPAFGAAQQAAPGEGLPRQSAEMRARRALSQLPAA